MPQKPKLTFKAFHKMCKKCEEKRKDKEAKKLGTAMLNVNVAGDGTNDGNTTQKYLSI